MKRFSIITDDMDHCIICGTCRNIHKHEAFFGTANRPLSIKYGLVVPLCGPHHNLGNDGVHNCRKTDLYIKRIAQEVFEKKYSHEEFMRIFQKNYL